MPTQLDNIENDVHEIKQDVKQLKERVLTLEVTEKVRQNMKTLKNQWIVIVIGFAAIEKSYCDPDGSYRIRTMSSLPASMLMFTGFLRRIMPAYGIVRV